MFISVSHLAPSEIEPQYYKPYDPRQDAKVLYLEMECMCAPA